MIPSMINIHSNEPTCKQKIRDKSDNAGTIRYPLGIEIYVNFSPLACPYFKVNNLLACFNIS